MNLLLLRGSYSIETCTYIDRNHFKNVTFMSVQIQINVSKLYVIETKIRYHLRKMIEKFLDLRPFYVLPDCNLPIFHGKVT